MIPYTFHLYINTCSNIVIYLERYIYRTILTLYVYVID